jgi:hypothetical protein
MEKERNFDLKYYSGRAVFDVSYLDEMILDYEVHYNKKIGSEIRDRIEHGGYMVVMWSKHSAQSWGVKQEIDTILSLSPDRVLFALLDQTKLPPLISENNYPTIQLYGDAHLSLINRLDDLIVCLYWLIYRTTTQRSLE